MPYSIKYKKARPIAASGRLMRYVLYVRKSSGDEDAQAKSIPDQIRACLEYAERENLIIVGEPVEESASAMMSGNRPKFDKILKDIENGKYDGILSWHPDRLSRNSLESGIIVDMLDNGIMKDLKFPTFQFTNNASGKMMLNILFAMSKQYSEGLSETIRRGVESNLEDGKSGGYYKWGYTRDEITGYYTPNAEHFDLIRRGWEMLMEGNTQSDIIDFWKENNVHRWTKITRKNKKQRKITISKQMTSNIFNDPFYYGILCQSGQEVDLRKVCGFIPMITEKEYGIVQAVREVRAGKPSKRKKRETFFPLRYLVKCGVCGGNMAVAPSKGSSGDWLLYYRCDNKLCTRSAEIDRLNNEITASGGKKGDRITKSIRAKAVFDGIYEALDRMEFTEKDYKRYDKMIGNHTETEIEQLRIEKHRKRGLLSQYKAEQKVKSRKLTDLPASTPQVARETLEDDLRELSNSIIDLEEAIKKIDEKLNDTDKIKLTKEEFLNLVKTAPQQMRDGSVIEKDALCRTMLLNIEIDIKNTPSYYWKEPFLSILKTRHVNFGATEATFLEHICIISQWLIEHKDFDMFSHLKISALQKKEQMATVKYTL